MHNLLMVFVLAATAICPVQRFLPLTGQAFPIDPNMIAVDPASGQRLLLGAFVVEIGKPVVIDANYCDEDGDPVTLSVDDPQTYRLTVDASERTYSIEFMPLAAGRYYATVTATDTPMEPLTALTRRGTFAVLVLPRNSPPVLGCGALRR